MCCCLWAVCCADTSNHCIRMLNIGTGVVSTVIGTGSVGNADGTLGKAAQLSSPSGVTVDPLDGSLIIADTNNRVGTPPCPAHSSDPLVACLLVAQSQSTALQERHAHWPCDLNVSAPGNTEVERKRADRSHPHRGRPDWHDCGHC